MIVMAAAAGRIRSLSDACRRPAGQGGFRWATGSGYHSHTEVLRRRQGFVALANSDLMESVHCHCRREAYHRECPSLGRVVVAVTSESSLNSPNYSSSYLFLNFSLD